MTGDQLFGLTQEGLNLLDALIPQVYPPTPSQVGKRKKASIIYALQGWRLVVEEVQGEYQFTREEYLSDLLFGSFLKDIIAAAPMPARGRLESAVHDLDRQFYACTSEGDDVSEGRRFSTGRNTRDIIGFQKDEPKYFE